MIHLPKHYEYFKMERLSASIHCSGYSIKRYRSHRDCGATTSRKFSAETLFGEK